MINATIEIDHQFITLSEKKPISKGCILYDSTYITFSEIIQISGCQRLGMGVQEREVGVTIKL